MKKLARLYDSTLSEHLRSYRQMAFLMGPRQVGKTTLGRKWADVYLYWDNDDHRQLILAGPGRVAQYAGLETITDHRDRVLTSRRLSPWRRQPHGQVFSVPHAPIRSRGVAAHGYSRFSFRWREMRSDQLLREDVRDLTRIQEIDQLRVLGRLLERRSGEQLVYSALARKIWVSENTIRSWISTLRSLFFGFTVRPWYRNVSRSLRKVPKWISWWCGTASRVSEKPAGRRRTAGRFDLPERKPCTGGYGLGYNRFIPTKERIQ